MNLELAKSNAVDQMKNQATKICWFNRGFSLSYVYDMKTD